MSRKENLTGKRFNRWTVLEESAPADKLKKTFWTCKCDCGVVRSVLATSLKSEKSKSCGCLKREVTSEIKRTHGMSASAEYRHYARMLYRCGNPESKDYRDYGARGILVCAEYKEDFINFYKDVGPKPNDGRKWSIGRKDNNRGYEVGNVRWELDEQQARNHSLQRNNTSGVAGVSVRYTEKDGDRVVARVNRLDGKRVSKSFSIGMHGLDKAMHLAVEWRDKMIAQLNEQGADYAPSHGTEKVYV